MTTLGVTPPMPNTVHPDLADIADAIRSVDVRRARGRVVMSQPGEIEASEVVDPFATESQSPILLTAHKCGAPAPFVAKREGDSAVYRWTVWMDDLGRYVAGDASMYWLGYDERFRP